MQKPLARVIVVGSLLALAGCSHLRPPLGYSEASGDPGGLSPGTAASMDMQQHISDNINSKVMRDAQQNGNPWTR